MDVPLRIELQDTQLVNAINGLMALMENPAPLLTDIGAQLEANIALRFETKTDPNGTAWAPLSQATKDIYASDWFKARNPAFKDGIPGSLLQRTNQMRASLAFNLVDGQAVDIGMSRATPKGSWQVPMLHEFGTRTMPRRGLLTGDPEAGTLGAGDLADVLAIVNDTLSSLL